MFVKKHMKFTLFVADMFFMVLAFLSATVLKFDGLRDGLVENWFKGNGIIILAVDLVTTAVLFVIFKVYRRMWQYMVVDDYIKTAVAFTISVRSQADPFILYMDVYLRSTFCCRCIVYTTDGSFRLSLLAYISCQERESFRRQEEKRYDYRCRRYCDATY